MSTPGTPVHNAADTTSADMKAWRPALLTHADEYLPERDELVAKASDAIRNNPMLQGGIRSQIDQVVGDYYRMSWEVDPAILRRMGLSALGASAFIDAIEEQFEVDAQSQECWFDASGKMSLTELCGCGMYGYYRQGELIQVAEYLEPATRRGDRPFATAVSLINPDRVISPFTIVEDRYLRAGFRTNRKGYAYGMYVLNRHPNEYWARFDPVDAFAYVPRHTPWGRARWLHVMHNEAPDQLRGRAGLIAGLRTDRMLEKFKETMLSNAITRAFYAAVIESDDPKAAYEGLSPLSDATPAESMTEAQLAAMEARGQYYAGQNELTLNGANIAHTFLGDKLRLLTPDGQVDFMDPFVQTFHRSLARGLDMSYEEFTGDYTETNYSGARAGKLVSEASRRTLAARVPAKQARMIATLWLEEQFSRARVAGVPGRTSRQRLNAFLNAKEALCQFDFYGPGIGHIDPAKGTQSAKDELLMGALTLKEYCNTYRGKSYRRVLRQRAQELEEAKSLGMDLHQMLGIIEALPADEDDEAEDARGANRTRTSE